MKLGEFKAGKEDVFDGKLVPHPLLELETVDIKTDQFFCSCLNWKTTNSLIQGSKKQRGEGEG
ncbi:hypothetical protein F2Q68_00002245 [Brassica cretica]|uniref:Uncharacterized protein n=1 Tax=Brassica cretica TaxID=69181 RepID=A0A8S9J4B2_BRACR|nr:hypothetical protein F2Q68_00002245 [Brassica cretica]